jgi:hypothetical protein
MKSWPSALGTVQNESRSAKCENWTRRRRYHRKWVMNWKTWKVDLTPSVHSKICPRAQNIKTGPGAVGSVENDFSSTKLEKWTGPSVLPKISPKAQNMKNILDAEGTVQNKFGSIKRENWTRQPRYDRKWVRERETWKVDSAPSEPLKMSLRVQNMKTGPDAFGAT